MSDSVNEYGLGAENTQETPPVTGKDEGPGLAHALGPSDGPFLGESAAEEEGTKFGLGADNTQASAPQPEPVFPDPLEHGLGTPDEP